MLNSKGKSLINILLQTGARVFNFTNEKSMLSK